MPLALVCGLPCSGKTARAEALKAHLEARGHTVLLVNEESLGIDRATGYEGSYAEKQTRAMLKQHVERHIHGDQVVICDSLNYIKGFRYELWCLARAAETTYCVLYCQRARDAAAAANAANTAFQWPEPLFSDLCIRFEAPLGNTKWDRPLYVFTDEAEGHQRSLPTAPVLVPSTCGPRQGEVPYAATPAPTFPSWTPNASAIPTGENIECKAASAVGVESAPAPKPKGATFVRKRPPPPSVSQPAEPTVPDLPGPSPPAPCPLPPMDALPDEAPVSSVDAADDDEEPVDPRELAGSSAAVTDTNEYLYITSQHSGAALVQRQRQEAVTYNAPYAAVADHLLTAARCRATVSTRKPPLAEGDLLQAVTGACQDVIDALVRLGADGHRPGEAVRVPGVPDPIILPADESLLTLPRLRQMRMQFLRVAQMHPPKDRQTALSMFAAFVNSTFEKG